MAARTLERGEQWRHDLADAFGRLEPEAFDVSARAQPGHGLEGRMSAAPLGRAGFFSVSGSPQVVRRTHRAISAAPADPLKLCIQLAGTAVIHQQDREVLIVPGQMALYDTGRPYDLRLSGDWSCAVVTVPREAIRVSGDALTRAMSRPFDIGNGPGQLLANLTEYALRSSGGADQASDRDIHVGEAGIELVASLLDGRVSDESDELSRKREAVLAYVRAHLRDPGLCHADVAASHHMSPRSLNRLFAGESLSVTDSIRRLRLEAIREELEDPRWRKSPVMVIASRWGFREQGHFTRAFKAEFGQTPASYRRSQLPA